MKKTIHTLLLIALVALSNGCSSKKANDGSVPLPPDTGSPLTPDGTGGTPSGCGTGASTGNSVCMAITSFQELGYYVATHPLNDPTDLRLTVELNDVGNGRYGGTVRISYMDNGQQFEGVFQSTGEKNTKIGGTYDGYTRSEFNRWFSYQGRNVFSGFYQDEYGAIVLVIENTLNTGDGSGGGFLTGSVWYRNFAQGLAPYNNTNTNCWFLTNGPYNCQSQTVMTKSDLYPSDEYRKLGTFTGLSKSAAFR